MHFSTASLFRAYSSTLRSHKTLEKQSVSRLSYLFAHLHLLFSYFPQSLIFSLLTFSTSEFLPGSASSWLRFSSVHIVGSFTSKLPSNIHIYIYICIYIYMHVTHMISQYMYTYTYIYIYTYYTYLYIDLVTALLWQLFNPRGDHTKM